MVFLQVDGELFAAGLCRGHEASARVLSTRGLSTRGLSAITLAIGPWRARISTCRGVSIQPLGHRVLRTGAVNTAVLSTPVLSTLVLRTRVLYPPSPPPPKRKPQHMPIRMSAENLPLQAQKILRPGQPQVAEQLAIRWMNFEHVHHDAFRFCRASRWTAASNTSRGVSSCMQR